MGVPLSFHIASGDAYFAVYDGSSSVCAACVLSEDEPEKYCREAADISGVALRIQSSKRAGKIDMEGVC